MSSLVNLLRTSRSTLAFLLLMLVFRSAVADWMYVPSGSMNPTLMDGDRILVDKKAYGLRLPFTLIRFSQGEAPQRGDIAVFESPKNGQTLVKRVIGVPGDRIGMVDDKLFINGVAASYSGVSPEVGREMISEFEGAPHRIDREVVANLDHLVLLLPERPALRSFSPIEIPADRYLMLGDNRDDSADSRYIGLVDRRLIFGRATRVVVSLDAEHHYRPRLDRTLAALR